MDTPAREPFGVLPSTGRNYEDQNAPRAFLKSPDQTDVRQLQAEYQGNLGAQLKSWEQKLGDWKRILTKRAAELDQRKQSIDAQVQKERVRLTSIREEIQIEHRANKKERAALVQMRARLEAEQKEITQKHADAEDYEQSVQERALVREQALADKERSVRATLQQRTQEIEERLNQREALVREKTEKLERDRQELDKSMAEWSQSKASQEERLQRLLLEAETEQARLQSQAETLGPRESACKALERSLAEQEEDLRARELKLQQRHAEVTAQAERAEADLRQATTLRDAQHMLEQHNTRQKVELSALSKQLAEREAALARREAELQTKDSEFSELMEQMSQEQEALKQSLKQQKREADRRALEQQQRDRQLRQWAEDLKVKDDRNDARQAAIYKAEQHLQQYLTSFHSKEHSAEPSKTKASSPPSGVPSNATRESSKASESQKSGTKPSPTAFDKFLSPNRARAIDLMAALGHDSDSSAASTPEHSPAVQRRRPKSHFSASKDRDTQNGLLDESFGDGDDSDNFIKHLGLQTNDDMAELDDDWRRMSLGLRKGIDRASLGGRPSEAAQQDSFNASASQSTRNRATAVLKTIVEQADISLSSDKEEAKVAPAATPPLEDKSKSAFSSPSPNQLRGSTDSPATPSLATGLSFSESPLTSPM